MRNVCVRMYTDMHVFGVAEGCRPLSAVALCPNTASNHNFCTDASPGEPTCIQVSQQTTLHGKLKATVGSGSFESKHS